MKGCSAFPKAPALLEPSITGTSPSDCLVSYPGHSLRGGGLTPSAKVHSVYSTAPADWASVCIYFWITTFISQASDAVKLCNE